jgi:hypothetical protein
MYINNETIVAFINKAQNKIADLASLIVERNGDDALLNTLLQLSDFLDALDDVYNDWSEDYIITAIDYYSTVANLNLIPILDIAPYSSSIIVINNKEVGAVTSVKNLHDFNSEVQKLIDSTIHNSTKQLQGGRTEEYYHLTREAYDKLMLLIYPFTNPTVSISKVSSIPSSVAGIYEKGKTITQYSIAPSIQINSGEEIVTLTYYKDNEVIGTLTKDYATSNFVYNGTITSKVNFKLIASFLKGAPVQSVLLPVVFSPPVFYTVEKRTSNFISPTKMVVNKSNGINITMTAPAGNAISSDPVVFKFKLPKEWGIPTSIGNNGLPYNFISSFKRSDSTHTLLDNSLEDYYLYELIDPTEGTFTINIKY